MKDVKNIEKLIWYKAYSLSNVYFFIENKYITIKFVRWNINVDYFCNKMKLLLDIDLKGNSGKGETRVSCHKYISWFDKHKFDITYFLYVISRFIKKVDKVCFQCHKSISNLVSI